MNALHPHSFLNAGFVLVTMKIMLHYIFILHIFILHNKVTYSSSRTLIFTT